MAMQIARSVHQERYDHYVRVRRERLAQVRRDEPEVVAEFMRYENERLAATRDKGAVSDA